MPYALIFLRLRYTVDCIVYILYSHVVLISALILFTHTCLCLAATEHKLAQALAAEKAVPRRMPPAALLALPPGLPPPAVVMPPHTVPKAAFQGTPAAKAPPAGHMWLIDEVVRVAVAEPPTSVTNYIVTERGDNAGGYAVRRVPEMRIDPEAVPERRTDGRDSEEATLDEQELDELSSSSETVDTEAGDIPLCEWMLCISGVWGVFTKSPHAFVSSSAYCPRCLQHVHTFIMPRCIRSHRLFSCSPSHPLMFTTLFSCSHLLISYSPHCSHSLSLTALFSWRLKAGLHRDKRFCKAVMC